MKITIFVDIEIPVDENFSRTGRISVTLDDEAIAEIVRTIDSYKAYSQTIFMQNGKIVDNTP